jgi:hypothetical protein
MHVDAGPYVALIAMIVGIAYAGSRRQWTLAGFFLLSAVAMLARFFGAVDVASSVTWASFLFLAAGIYLLVIRERMKRAGS